jgi:probable rRNA maturation factor
MAYKVNYFYEEVDFTLHNRKNISSWLSEVAVAENTQIKEINYIFCSNEYLYQINVDYLDHDTYTDIITFDNSDEEGWLEGDIFISIEFVRENALELQIPFENELYRVMVHGLLHLIGYKDKSPTDKTLMTSKEDLYLHKILNL